MIIAPSEFESKRCITLSTPNLPVPFMKNKRATRRRKAAPAKRTRLLNPTVAPSLPPIIAPSESPPRILRLPTEILCHVFSHLQSSRSYISLQLACRRLSIIGRHSSTGRQFAHTWFKTNCNDSQGPSVLEFLARYIRLHCTMGSGHEKCSIAAPAGLWPVRPLAEEYYIRSRRSTREGFTWRVHAFEGLNNKGKAVHMSLSRALKQIELQMETCKPPTEGWNISTIRKVLDISDVAFAEVMLQVYFSHEAIAQSEPVGETKAAWVQWNMNRTIGCHMYLTWMFIIRDAWKCGCILKNQTSMAERSAACAEWDAFIQEKQDERGAGVMLNTTPLKIWRFVYDRFSGKTIPLW
ncbi:hypothetical protein BJ508DRAFT_314279 [Ascobolus immersus RN42]|uniref:F-box domain-containing protein n=1 Tax=Ascobolus immersus RN42 TaxID=1160509 RepID=A0A3N4HTG5_ASCIM|nr:hypothetical protein BJ508DRAFT_314279 [Ascobolus immersus RN42]